MARLKFGQAPLPKRTEPRRARSNYFIFCDEQRAVLKESNTKYSMAELSKHLAQKWKQMSLLEKKPYFEKATALRNEFVKKYGDNTKKGLKTTAAQKVPAGWKLINDVSSGIPVFMNLTTKECRWVWNPPASAVADQMKLLPTAPSALFCRQMRSEAIAVGLPKPKNAKLISMWKTLDPAERKLYCDKSKEIRTTYMQLSVTKP